MIWLNVLHLKNLYVHINIDKFNENYQVILDFSTYYCCI